LDCGFSAGGGDLGFIPNPDELKAYTPVPGGVGALTSLFLVKNALTLVKLS
jgi:5,10-methylene-tetrahydrofolate dehydrogenase/methenyl tetrahydrofolate cyclohydrolase